MQRESKRESLSSECGCSLRRLVHRGNTTGRIILIHSSMDIRLQSSPGFDQKSRFYMCSHKRITSPGQVLFFQGENREHCSEISRCFSSRNLHWWARADRWLSVPHTSHLKYRDLRTKAGMEMRCTCTEDSLVMG